MYCTAGLLIFGGVFHLIFFADFLHSVFWIDAVGLLQDQLIWCEKLVPATEIYVQAQLVCSGTILLIISLMMELMQNIPIHLFVSFTDV